jgi:hypothetical protein
MSVIEDIQHRSAHIRWPEGIVPEQADLFAHNDIVIAAPPAKIWEYLVHATAWPDWYTNARIGWYGETDQWLAYHTWLLEPRDESSTYVVMERPAPGPTRGDSPAPIPATCTAVTICGTSASSSSAKAPRTSGGRTL